jgi:hypothetical protein
MSSNADKAASPSRRPWHGQRRWPRRLAMGVGALIPLALLVGWVYRTELSAWLSPAGSQGGASGIANPAWASDRGETAIPGIDHASVTCGLWSDGRTVVAVWTDASGGSSTLVPRAATRAEGFVYEGHHRGPDGRHVDCRCSTPDGRTGAVTINDKTFDLAHGALFLVSTQGGRTEVRQLQRDTSKLAPEGLKDLARNDQEILDFFSSFAQAK